MKNHQSALFLCTGNFYRSRHAEAWFNHLCTEHQLQWRARSKGFRPHLATEDLSHFVVERLESLDVPTSLTNSKPSKVSSDDLAQASLVIALYENEHRPMMREQFAPWVDRIRYWRIPDIDEVSPDIALPRIEAKVEHLIESLLSGHALGVSHDVLVEF